MYMIDEAALGEEAEEEEEGEEERREEAAEEKREGMARVDAKPVRAEGEEEGEGAAELHQEMEAEGSEGRLEACDGCSAAANVQRVSRSSGSMAAEGALQMSGAADECVSASAKAKHTLQPDHNQQRRNERGCRAGEPSLPENTAMSGCHKGSTEDDG